MYGHKNYTYGPTNYVIFKEKLFHVNLYTWKKSLQRKNDGLVSATFASTNSIFFLINRLHLQNYKYII